MGSNRNENWLPAIRISLSIKQRQRQKLSLYWQRSQNLVCWTVWWRILLHLSAHTVRLMFIGFFGVFSLHLKPLSTIFQVYRACRSVLLVEETKGPGENHRHVASHWQTLSHNVVHLALIYIRTHNISGIGTDCIGSCKSNYHTITVTTLPPGSLRYRMSLSAILGNDQWTFGRGG